MKVKPKVTRPKPFAVTCLLGPKGVPECDVQADRVRTGSARSSPRRNARCSTIGGAAGYKPASFIGGGYTDLRLNDTTYQIHVDGNGYTSDSRSGQLALLRAADVTLQAGYSRFLVVSGNTRTSVVGSTPIVANQIGSSVFLSGGDTITAPKSDLIIRMLPPTDPAFPSAVDAKLIFDQLKAKFG